MANNISVTGFLGGDAEKKFTQGGDAVLSFSVGDSVGFGDRKSTNWWRCNAWGKQAEGQLVEYLKKGQQVVVFGEVTLREYTDRDGAKRLSPDIRVNSVQLVGKRDDDGGQGGGGGYRGGDDHPPPPRRQEGQQQPPQGGGQPRQSAPQPDDDDSDIPF